MVYTLPKNFNFLMQIIIMVNYSSVIMTDLNVIHAAD